MPLSCTNPSTCLPPIICHLFVLAVQGRLTDLPIFLRVDPVGRLDTPADFGNRAHMYTSAEGSFGRGSSFAPMVIHGTGTTGSYAGEGGVGVATAAKASRAKSSLTRAPPLGGKRWRGLQRKNHFQLGTDEPSFGTYSGRAETGITGRRKLGTSLPVIKQQNGQVDHTPQHSPAGLSPNAPEPDKRTYLDLVSHTISPFAQQDVGKKVQQQRGRRVKLPDIHS